MAIASILVVDDEPAITMVIYECLADEGYQVATASNGAEALVVAHTARPDIVLTDVMMPVMDGIALCRALAAVPALAVIPVVLMSAQAHLPATAACRYAAFLSKPFDLERLLRVVGECRR